MKTWKHLNFEQRKLIGSCIAQNYKLIETARILKLDPTTISKEVKRNRMPILKDAGFSDECKHIKRWPHVCNYCSLKYQHCIFKKYRYIAKYAQEQANIKLVSSRRGLDLDSDEFKKIDSIIKAGTDNNKSIYQIKIENPNDIVKSLTTLYRYINKGFLTTKRIDLPYAVTYKKRKHNKKYDYKGNNKIDRSNHTYLDYLSFLHQNPRANVWQLDFLGSIKSDSKAIITFFMPHLHFSIIDIITNPDSQKVVRFFDNIENKIGTEAFTNLIPVILTDRDPCFSDIDGICFSKLTGEERCKLFFCDPYVSSQKPNVENMNKQLRKYFKKGLSIDKFTKKDIKNINNTILNTALRSLDGNTPKEAFCYVFNDDLFIKLTK